ncbi:hypothetical protein Curi_c04370 [Gottschalkia acidurici 9a]|uniref:Uncharacterized protein n=1 Tax=Gottschalkia acidurici (strain ATCC 7906 / DSM 604 / BCRC 14475 / CIP 104303 / KCTC 5404 / NCIMB 10678 / 9a) TaxID=1128398 RepID=K0AXK3_GOTA9|nr:hypothetical protein [Gottschalkia acidurici]AFS77512.1 hypothetical protein Curi_c04370 [Gottschalkia acidurici 9a]
MLTTTQEKSLIKLEIDDYTTLPNDVYEDETSTDLKGIEFEMITPIDFSDRRKVEIYNGIAEVDERLAIINHKVEELNAEIDRLTNHADGLDYTIAVASGIIAGAIDIFYVREFSLDRGKEWSNGKVNNFVMNLAKKKGYKGDDLQGAIRHLEQFGTPSDSVTAQFGGGKQHHLRDFAHHPTPVGLTFSLLTQFTGMAYGTNTLGAFQVVPVENKSFIGENFPEKITFGLVYWFLHMASDMVGSNVNAGAGTGLPGPILSLVKELSSLPIFNNSKAIQELRVNISKLFNGTLLAKRDENGKIMKGPDGKPLIEKFDLRTEVGVAYEIGRQAIPVVVNEALVRGFYFLRRLIQQLKEKESLKHIEWKKTLPFKNRTIVRMMTIATGTFTAIDLADAGIRAVIKSGGFNPATLGNFILRVNFVGIGRFAIAVTTDVAMGIKKSKKENERIRLRGEGLQLLNAKVFYKEADMWIAAENIDKAIEEVYVIMEKAAEDFVDTWNEIREGSEKRREYIDKINKDDGDFAQELLDLIEWG